MDASSNEESYITLSAKVQCLANDIYKEFEKLISLYGDKSVETIMPLIVNILENLDDAYCAKDQLTNQHSILKEEHEQLLNEYESEKVQRKQIQEVSFVHYLESCCKRMLKQDDYISEMTRTHEGQQEELNMRLKRVEISLKNHSEQSARFEERENEMRRELSKSKANYSELLKKHADLVERSKTASSNSVTPTEAMTSSSTLHSSRPTDPFVTSRERSRDSSRSRVNNYDPILDTQISSSSRSSNMGGSSGQSLRNEFDTLLHPNSQSSLLLARQRVMRNIIETTPELLLEPDLSCRPDDPLFDDLSVSGDYVSEDSQDAYTGVSREVRNVLKENRELAEGNEALKIVATELSSKNSFLESQVEQLTAQNNAHLMARSSLDVRMKELEMECSKSRQVIVELQSALRNGEVNEAGLPMSKRCQFSRAEMSRVLIERNYYKQQYQDLHDYLNSTHQARPIPKRGGLFAFFDRFLRDKPAEAATKPARPSAPEPSTKFVSSVNQPNVSPRRVLYLSSSDSQKTDASGDPARLISPCKPGWLCPAMRNVRPMRASLGGITAAGRSARAASVNRNAPMSQSFGQQESLTGQHRLLASTSATPLFIRPIHENQPNMMVSQLGIHLLQTGLFQLWCAAANFANHGLELDNGSALLRQYFSFDESDLTSSTPKKETRQSNTSLASTNNSIFEDELPVSIGEPDNRVCESVWLCSMSMSPSSNIASPDTRVRSQMVIIDPKSPQELVDSFAMSKNVVLCMHAVPGVTGPELAASHALDAAWQAVPETATADAEQPDSTTRGRVNSSSSSSCCDGEESLSAARVKCRLLDGKSSGSDDSETRGTPRDARSATPTSLLATMWLGCQDGTLFVHSTVRNRHKYLHSIRLPDSVTCICHLDGCVFVGLANGSVFVFRRRYQPRAGHHLHSSDDSMLQGSVTIGTWDLSEAVRFNCGWTQQAVKASLAIGPEKCVWLAQQNRILVVQCPSFCLHKSFEVHVQREKQVRCMAWIGDGVWVALRMDSVLRLYHAFTQQHLQDVDVTLPITALIKYSLDASEKVNRPVHVTSLMASRNQLWVGTSLGLVVTMPYAAVLAPADRIEVPNGPEGDFSLPSIGYVSTVEPAYAQVSRHSHQGEVRLLQQIRLSQGRKHAKTDIMLLSGGCGYVKLQTRDEAYEGEPKPADNNNSTACLLSWQLPSAVGLSA